ncbi:MAG: sigma-70 family RNA polymerase sigma factor [Peptococcaceae bacterium]|nr:sigma-70 family RNA polymerase sigma factor [Peptococcaceae bacterium]
MGTSQFERDTAIALALKTYSDMVYRICFIYLRDRADIDDVFQEVFLKLFQKKTPFVSKEHEKAWLIRVTINQCKDVVKSFWRKKIDLVENIELPLKDSSENEILQVVLSLPQKYKDVIYLYYYEEYTVPQMAKILEQNENSLYSHLHRAKKLLKQKLEGTEYEYSY